MRARIGERSHRARCAVDVTRVLTLGDRRDLAWIEYGVPDGLPVMAFHGSPGTRLFFAAQAEDAKRPARPEWVLAWMDRNLPPCDVAVIQRTEIRAALRDEFARPLSPTAAKAAVQDLRLERVPWGFALRDIATRVHVWHGDLDRNVVVQNGVYQADVIPAATLHRLPSAGHWLIHSHFDDIISTLST
jgi:pimeloyl-ACP methyl ester carboxylesterase